MKKEKIWIFDLNKIMIFRAVAWGILTRPQVGDFQVATGDLSQLTPLFRDKKIFKLQFKCLCIWKIMITV